MRSKIFFLLSLDIPIDHKPVHRAVVVVVVVVMSISRGVSLNICRSRKIFLTLKLDISFRLCAGHLMLYYAVVAVVLVVCIISSPPLSLIVKKFFLRRRNDNKHHTPHTTRQKKSQSRVEHTLRDLLQTVVSHDCGI